MVRGRLLDWSWGEFAIRILHVENVAGVPAILAKAQRASGHNSAVMETRRNPFNFPHDLEMYYGGAGVLHDLRNMRRVVKVSKDYDIIHVHGGINWKRMDVLGMHLLKGKPLAVHYHGSETRMGYGMAYRSQVKVKFVSRPDLLKWHKDGIFVPNPIDSIEPAEFDESAVPSIVHVSSNPKLKGTELIKEAMKELADEGLAFRFELIENQSHAVALEHISKSNVLIDQVLPSNPELPSIIGMVSLEAMARGKAVISTFDEEYRKYYPGCPVLAIDFCKSQLKDEVRKIIQDLGMIKKIGTLGIKYANEVHSPKIISDKLICEYEKALQ